MYFIGLFQGLFPTIIGISPYSGTSWCVKQSLHEFFPTIAKRKPTTFEALVLNSIAGLSAQLVTYPLDIVRRRMQLTKLEEGQSAPSIRYVSINVNNIFFHSYIIFHLKSITF